MNKIFFILLATIILAFSVEGRIFRIIDDFTDTPYIVRYSPTLGTGEVYDDTAPYYWFSPYSNGDGELRAGTPVTDFKSGLTNVMGSQRDIVIGHISTMDTGTSIPVKVNRADASGLLPANFQVSLPTGFIGGIYLQYDGVDNDVSALIGSRLGNRLGGDNGLGANADGTVDFTFGGFAKGILISIQTDLPIDYELKVVSRTENTNVFGFGHALTVNVQPNELTGFTRFYFTFTDRAWGTNPFDWTHVAGFQIKIFTSAGAPTTQSKDTKIFLIQIGTFQVGGRVRADCSCDNVGLIALPNIGINLYRTATSTTVPLATTTTDSNGAYVFIDQFPSTNGNIDTSSNYRICLADTNLVRCPGTLPNTANNCYDFQTTDPFVDLLTFDFTISRSTTLIIPDDLDFECASQSTLPPVTGNARIQECDGTSTTINTWSDDTTGNSCVATILRRWTNVATGEFGTQTIIVRDTTIPRFTTTPTSTSVSCDNPTPTMANWVNVLHAGAVGEDACTTTTIISDWDTTPVIGCGFEVVNFRVRDACGLLSAALPATYTVADNADPTILPSAQALNIECNLKVASQNPNNQIASWINNHGNAAATDSCTTTSALTWRDSFSDTVISGTGACDFSEAVTFTVYDLCGRSSTTTATARVTDSLGPTFTTQAQPASSQCATDGSNNTAFQAWRAAHGNAVATDDCVTSDTQLTWSDNYTGGAITGTCSNSITVAFTVTDVCGRSSITTNSYSITDTTPPVITTQASAANPTCDGSGNLADWNAFISSHGGAAATDNCGTVTWTDNAPPVANRPQACGEFAVVTFRAFQQCTPALFAETTATYTIRDTVPPVWVSDPTSASVECGTTAPTAFVDWLNNNAGASISDVCSNTNIRILNNFNPPNLQNGCNNVATVTFTGQDSCSNRNTPKTASFSIIDSQAPTITTQATSSTITCNIATNQQQFNDWRTNHGGAQASDCLAITWSFNDTAPIGNGCNTARVVQFTASDPCAGVGHSSTTIASFTVTDDQRPTITRNATSSTFECDGDDNQADIQFFLNNQGGATATDNCGPVTWSNNFVSLSADCDESSTVIFTATDPCALTSTTVATITVRDTGAPIISPRASDSVVDCNTQTNSNQFQAFLDNRGGARATDLCQSSSSLVWTNTQQPAPVGCSSVTVTFTVTDACQQSASTTARFTIIDDDGPTITQNPSSVSFECNGSGNVVDYTNWVSNHGGATATDACSTLLQWSTNAPSTGPVGCGSVPVIFTVSDQCQNSASATATFTVIDSSAPSIITPAQNVTVPCDGRTNNGNLEAWLLNHGNAIASDVCYATSSLLWRNDFIGLSSSDRCTQYVDVVFQVIDPCGQRSQTVGTYTISDTTPPVMTRQAENRVYECDDVTNMDDINNWILVNGAANAIDTCSEIEWTNDFDLVYPIECQGAKFVTFTASDLCGLSVSSTASVTIEDTVKPTFLNFPRDVILTCADPTDPAWTRSPDVFDFYCDNDLTPTYNDIIFQEPADRLCPGDYIITRTWYLIDDCGNGVAKNQTITVTLPDGPCTFTACPPCDETFLCCESSLEPVPCSPVPCNPVECAAVDCTIVPCLPKVCGSAHVPIYDDGDDGPIFTSPIPIAESVTCEPIYVYVFDDDENNAVPVESANSSSFIVASFTLILSIFFLMI